MDSPAIARAVVEELLAAGMTDVVVCPGSRSAPLALTLADAERRGFVRMHVRIDERSGAYLALGLAKISGRPVAVVTTSGTAAVNLHPAIVEAAYSGLPLVAITADRPGAMRGSGANQTIDQRGLYGVDVVDGVDLTTVSEADLRATVTALIDASVSLHGPVHLNVPLAEPLVGPGEHGIGAVHVRSTLRPLAVVPVPLDAILPAGVNAAHGLIIAGDFDDEQMRQALGRLADVMGWPIISEPSGNLSGHPQALQHGPLVLSSFTATREVPDVVMTVGRIGLHRPEIELLRTACVHIAVDVPPRLGRVDPAQTAHIVVDAVPEPRGGSDPEWLRAWRAADDRAARALDSAAGSGSFTGVDVARIVARHAGADDLLVIGASFPVRHVSAYGGALRARCIGNRGTAGIDGVISTAWGAALAHADQHPLGMTYALVGDLTALYDRNGLLAGPSEQLPRLTYVVIDNDGGGIFSTLEQGAPAFAEDFERVFGTPHGGDLMALLAAPRVTAVAVATTEELREALMAPSTGVRVVVARCASRGEESAHVSRMNAAVLEALT